jgi:hypothetical protein
MNGVPMFGQSHLEYKHWRIRKKIFLKEHGYDIWKSVVTRYNATKKPKIASKKQFKKNNKITMDLILEGLYDSIKDKVGK